MAKYIIDIPDEEETMWEGFNGDLFIPITMNKGTRTWVNTDLKMTPYTEPDRKAIEDEVWSLAREIAYCMSVQECIDTGMLHDDDIYDSASGVLEKLTYQEAKAKYDSWKKKKEQVRVGDEVEYDGCGEKVRFIVTGIKDSTAYGFRQIYEYEDVSDVGEYCDIDMLIKTGRHFDEVEELLNKMRDQND